MSRPLDLLRRTARAVLSERARQRLRHAARPPAPDLMAISGAHSLVTPLNLHLIAELVQRLGRLGIEGDIVECGVYKGGSAAVLGSAMVRLDDERPRKLWLFDSFAGMPPAGEQDGAFSHTLKGTYVGSEQQTRALLAQAGVPPGRFEIVTGLYADTFPTVEIPRIALLHIDCDFYEPHKLTLEKFYIRPSRPGGFVVLNDYGIYKGARGDGRVLRGQRS
jgi:O-methyltransferase